MTKAIPWTLIDGLLTLRMNGTSINITEEHPNFPRIMSYLKEKRFRVVETLVYRMEGMPTLDDRIHASETGATSDAEVETGITHFGTLPILYCIIPVLAPVLGRISNIIVDPINEPNAVIQNLWILALRTGKDAFAYQSLEEKFPGDLKVTPAGLVSEYRAKTQTYEAICQCANAEDCPEDEAE